MTTDLDIQLTATSDCPLVGVVMGSDSDWPTMEPAVAALADADNDPFRTMLQRL